MGTTGLSWVKQRISTGGLLSLGCYDGTQTHDETWATPWHEGSLSPSVSFLDLSRKLQKWIPILFKGWFFFLPEWLKQWLKPPACRHTNTHSVLTQVWTLIVVVDVVMDFYGADLIWSSTWGAQPHTLTHTHRTHLYTHLYTSDISNTMLTAYTLTLSLIPSFYSYFIFILLHIVLKNRI